MSNWCSSGITFYSRNKKSITELKSKMEEIFHRESVPKPGYGKFIADYAKAFYPKIDSESIDCRGTVTLHDTIGRVEKYYSFKIFTETAGNAKLGIWYKILRDFYPGIRMAFVAEECGCEYFIKWDETGLFYPHDYYVDMAYPTGEDDVEYVEDHEFYSMQEICDWLDTHLPFKYERKDNADELEAEISSKLEEYDSDEFFCTIAKYREVNPVDFNFYK